eukprot:15434660-Alexandrium_andersonii.AAC.1
MFCSGAWYPTRGRQDSGARKGLCSDPTRWRGTLEQNEAELWPSTVRRMQESVWRGSEARAGVQREAAQALCAGGR